MILVQCLSRPTLPVLYCLAAIALFSCNSHDEEVVSEPEELVIRDSVVCYSLLGQPLKHLPEPISVYREKDSLLQIARAKYESDPSDLDNIIWYGRRLGYLTNYRESMTVYTRGLHIHPKSANIYRFRGHRYISMRRFEEAINDLTLAAELARDLPMETEPDGIPNARNTPLSNLHFNIWYHLGLAYFLQGEYDRSAEVFDSCMAFADNPDLVIATSYWGFLANIRNGDTTAANSLLEPVSPGMDVIENDAYLDLLLLFKGERTAQEVLTIDDSSGASMLDVATKGFGVASYHLINGNKDEARRIMEKVLDTGFWPAFGYIAAEVDMTGVVN